MDTETLLRRNVAELRALLDLSYARERALVDSLRGFQFLHEGAAIAPDREAKAKSICATAEKLLRELTESPLPNHGLFADYARVSAEHKAALSLNAALNQTLTNAIKQTGDLHSQVHALHARVMEAEASRDAVVVLLNRADLTDTVIAAVRDLVKSRTEKPA